MIMVPRPGLLPYQFQRIGDVDVVQFIDPQRLDWSQGFFRWSLPAEREADALMTVTDWIAAQQEGSDRIAFTQTSGIFHVARCGSTLLARNIKSTERAVVLAEPTFMRVLRQSPTQALTRDIAMRLVHMTIAAWQNWAMEQDKRLVIKFGSQYYHIGEALAAHLPGGRFLFLYRDPLPVIESLVRRAPNYIRGPAMKPVSAEGESVSAPPLNQSTVGNAAARYCEILKVFRHWSGGNLKTVHYDDLANRFPDILNYFSLQGEGNGPDPWDGGTYAKRARGSGQRNYVPVTQDKLDIFAADNAAALRPARRSYDKFHAHVTGDPAIAL